MILNIAVKPSKFLNWAAGASYNSEHGIYKMGAVIVSKGKIIGVGWNKNKSHPKALNFTRKIHAELAALVGFRNGDLLGAHMYVVRTTNGGAMATSKPCKYCMILIQESGIEAVTFIDDQGQVVTDKL